LLYLTARGLGVTLCGEGSLTTRKYRNLQGVVLPEFVVLNSKGTGRYPMWRRKSHNKEVQKSARQ